MTVLARVADVAHRGGVLGLMSLLGYQVYQTGRNITESQVDNKYKHTEIFKKINEKVAEDGKDRHNFNSVPDRYEADDDSYLKSVPNLNQATK